MCFCFRVNIQEQSINLLNCLSSTCFRRNRRWFHHHWSWQWRRCRRSESLHYNWNK